MRIVCEKCTAAYAIDDRLITARGVRAQCPKCRHLQLVTKDGSTAAAPSQLPAPASAPSASPVTAPRTPPQNFPGGPPSPPATTPVSTPRVPPEAFKSGPTPAGAARSPDATRPPAVMPAVAPVVPPIAAPVARAPSAAPPVADWDVPSSVQTSTGPAQLRAQDATQKIDFDLAGPPGAQASTPAPARKPSAAAKPAPIDDALLAPRGIAPATMGCRDCGKPLSDAFDQALGVCDSCRAKADAAASGNAPADRPGGAADLGLPRAAPSAFDDALDAAAVASAAPERPRPPPPTQAGFSMGADPERAGGKGKWVALLAVLLLAVAGGGVFAFKDTLFGAGKSAEQDVLPAAVSAVLPAWRMANPEVSGTAQAHLTEGGKLLAEDRFTSYEQAIEAFQKALILDPKSDDAIAGYVQALSLGAGANMDDGAFEEASKLITASERRSARAPQAVLAHANLLLARPQDSNNVAQARTLAEEVLGKTRDPFHVAHAHLVVGRSWQSTSSALAVDSFTRALDLNPALRPALFQRALAHELSGNSSAALADLNERLTIDPEHWASNAELARIYREAARLDLAREVYRAVLAKNPDHPRARLELAVFRYQAEGKTQEALAELRAMAKSLERYDDREQAEILTHLATAERLAGNDAPAVDAAQRALKVAPQSAAPQLQLFLISLRREQLPEAEKALDALRGELEDVGLQSLLEGRLRMAQLRWDDAVVALDAAVKADPRRIDARLLSGVAAASAGKADAAYARLFEAAKADPARGMRPSAAVHFVQPLPLVRGFEDRILKLATSREDVLPKLYEAVYRYHLGDAQAAARLSAQVTDLDTNNALGHSWNAFALLKGGNARGARASGERATAAGRQVAIGHYALGSAAYAGGRDEDARRALQEALKLDPALLGAEQKLAELDLKRKDAASARTRLVHILSLDPAWLPAKQLLFEMDKEKPGEGADPR